MTDSRRQGAALGLKRVDCSTGCAKVARRNGDFDLLRMKYYNAAAGLEFFSKGCGYTMHNTPTAQAFVTSVQ